MDVDHDTFLDQVRGLLEHEQGFTVGRMHRHREVIGTAAFSAWLRGEDSMALAHKLAGSLRE